LIASFATMAVAQITLERDRADEAGHDKVTTQRLMVQALLSLTEVRHAETGRHSRRTQEYGWSAPAARVRHAFLALGQLGGLVCGDLGG